MIGGRSGQKRRNRAVLGACAGSADTQLWGYIARAIQSRWGFVSSARHCRMDAVVTPRSVCDARRPAAGSAHTGLFMRRAI